jgi:hypothetical protein
MEEREEKQGDYSPWSSLFFFVLVLGQQLRGGGGRWCVGPLILLRFCQQRLILILCILCAVIEYVCVLITLL